jgi:site-specific recombinase XerD
MILMLLRTGMRIGELLNVQHQDLNMKEQKVIIHRGAKNGLGRMVYFSKDARSALKSWLRKRDSETDTLFHSRNRGQLSYAGARAMFNKHLARAGLLDKGYTLHCLRHTYASELLNAGIRLESLQKLMGHRDIEVTRRYARLTDITLEKEYFRAMSVIEKGDIHGQYRFDL